MPYLMLTKHAIPGGSSQIDEWELFNNIGDAKLAVEKIKKSSEQHKKVFDHCGILTGPILIQLTLLKVEEEPA